MPTQCQYCGTPIQRERFVRWCPTCRKQYGQFADRWPDKDEIVPGTNSILKWSQRRITQYFRHNPLTALPVICGNCGLERLVPASQVKRLIFEGTYSGLCRPCLARSKAHRLKISRAAKDRFRNSDGYVLVNISRLPSQDQTLAQPMAAPSNLYYVLEHRLVMARYLGRSLKRHERVHHLNGIKDDNRLENLMLTDRIEHNQIEIRVYNELRAQLKDALKRIEELEHELAIYHRTTS